MKKYIISLIILFSILSLYFYKNMTVSCRDVNSHGLFLSLQEKSLKNINFGNQTYQKNFSLIDKDLQQSIINANNICKLIDIYIQDITDNSTKVGILVYGNPDLTDTKVDNMYSKKFLLDIAQSDKNNADYITNKLISYIQEDKNGDIESGLLLNILGEIQSMYGWTINYETLFSHKIKELQFNSYFDYYLRKHFK